MITINWMAKSVELDCQLDASLESDTMKFRKDTLLNISVFHCRRQQTSQEE